ncbi:MAG: glycine cleavage system protein [Actinomycetota bacterium]|jgi:glycine cleavage system H protein|nr:glycine cleavage system protein [Actinomycetota bacterium]
MSEVPDDRRYTKQHEWARQDGARILIGITDYAQDQLGDVVFVGLPESGSTVTEGQPLGEVESTKSVSDVFSPVTATVVEKNVQVEQKPELVNTDPYGSGWLVAVDAEGVDLSALMSAGEYRNQVEGEGS